MDAVSDQVPAVFVVALFLVYLIRRDRCLVRLSESIQAQSILLREQSGLIHRLSRSVDLISVVLGGLKNRKEDGHAGTL